jgi:hypothetical protein
VSPSLPSEIPNQSEPLLSSYRILKAVHAVVTEGVKWHSDSFDLKTKTTFWPLSDQIPALRVHIGRSVSSQLMDYLPERPRITPRVASGRGASGMGSNSQLVQTLFSSIDSSRRSSPRQGERVLPVRHQQPISPSHHSPVIFVSSSTKRAYLIMTAIGINAWPGEPMRATSSEKPLQKVHCLTPSLRLLHVSNQRLKNGLGRRLSRS